MNARRAGWARAPERSSRLGLALMRWLALTLGRASTRWLLYPLTWYFLLAGGAAGAASRDYLRRVFGRPARLAERWRHLFCFACTLHDRLFLLNDRAELFDIEIEGQALVDAALARGNGVFLLGSHLGSFEALRAAGRWHSGLRVVMAMYEDNARQINAALDVINPALARDVLPIGRINSMLQLEARLAKGCLVGMLGDRRLGDEPKARRDFLGAPADFPLGPLRLAALMRRPVLFMSALYLGGNRYRLHFSPLADFSTPSHGARQAALQTALSDYVTRLEAQCRAAPYNWFNFYDFWDCS